MTAILCGPFLRRVAILAAMVAMASSCGPDKPATDERPIASDTRWQGIRQASAAIGRSEEAGEARGPTADSPGPSDSAGMRLEQALGAFLPEPSPASGVTRHQSESLPARSRPGASPRILGSGQLKRLAGSALSNIIRGVERLEGGRVDAASGDLIYDAGDGMQLVISGTDRLPQLRVRRTGTIEPCIHIAFNLDEERVYADLELAALTSALLSDEEDNPLGPRACHGRLRLDLAWGSGRGEAAVLHVVDDVRLEFDGTSVTVARVTSVMDSAGGLTLQIGDGGICLEAAGEVGISTISLDGGRIDLSDTFGLSVRDLRARASLRSSTGQKQDLEAELNFDLEATRAEGKALRLTTTGTTVVRAQNGADAWQLEAEVPSVVTVREDGSSWVTSGLVRRLGPGGMEQSVEPGTDLDLRGLYNVVRR